MDKSKPRVLIIENSIDVTGALKSITRTAYDLTEFYDFHFIVPKNSKGRFWIEAKGFPVEELPMKELSRRIKDLIVYTPQLLLNAIRLRSYIKKNNISIIHVNDLYNLLPPLLAILGNKTPYVCHIRFLPDKFPKKLFSFWLNLHLKYASKIIAVSNSVLRQLPVHLKLEVIHNELPIEERHAPVGIQELDKKENFGFLYLSNFIRGKGQDHAIRAFAKIHTQLPEWRMKFVGGDMGMKKNQEFKEELKTLAKDNGVFDKIEWCDFVEDVEREYKTCDIALNFSESESFSITCLEALFFGRPLIATDCGGPAEIIDHGVTGLLTKNMDVNKMAEAMLLLAKDGSMREQFSINARIHVREKFSVDNTSFKLRQVYDAILRDGDMRGLHGL